ncbi:MAG: AmmeMemoRadiSam system protein B [Candidatus Limnocylindrales bacterium]
MTTHGSGVDAAIRAPAVAGTFYPARPDALADLVARLLAEADRRAASAAPPEREPAGPPIGLLVPHAGLVYSGLVAAAAWRRLGSFWSDAPVTVVALGTNHGAAWLRGVAGWGSGAWRTPLGDSPIDGDLADAIAALGAPYLVDPAAHLGEHSIEVQLPFIQAVARQARIVPLAVATGTGHDAIAAGARLGALLAQRRADGQAVVLAISSDMAHYPWSDACARATDELLPPILGLDPVTLARSEGDLRTRRTPGLVCGMCGIEPAVFGLGALRAMGATGGTYLAAATSADAGGPPDHTVGYLAVAFTA